jgi:hypothetical protein
MLSVAYTEENNTSERSMVKRILAQAGHDYKETIDVGSVKGKTYV